MEGWNLVCNSVSQHEAQEIMCCCSEIPRNGAEWDNVRHNLSLSLLFVCVLLAVCRGTMGVHGSRVNREEFYHIEPLQGDFETLSSAGQGRRLIDLVCMPTVTPHQHHSQPHNT